MPSISFNASLVRNAVKDRTPDTTLLDLFSGNSNISFSHTPDETICLETGEQLMEDSCSLCTVNESDDQTLLTDTCIEAAPPKFIYHSTTVDSFMRPLLSDSEKLEYHQWLSMQTENPTPQDEGITCPSSSGDLSDDSDSDDSEDDDNVSKLTAPIFQDQNIHPDNLPWRPPGGDSLIWHSSEPIPKDLYNANIPVPDAKHNSFYRQPMTAIEKLLLKIDLICENANCPRWVPDKIVAALREAVLEDGIDFRKDRIPKYESFLKAMQKRFPCTQPQTIPVTLESPLDDFPDDNHPISDPLPKRHKSGQSAKVSNVNQDIAYNRTQVVRFPFLKQVEDILSDHTLFSDIRNMHGVVNPEDPFGMLGPTDGSLDDIVSGEWYRSTYTQAKLIQDTQYPGEPFCVIPIVLYMDKTGLDKMNRIAMEPVILMLGLLNRKTRNLDCAKRLLGYLPDLELKSSAEK